MLKSQLIHPPLLEALAAAGHGSKVLIADSNYPASTTLGDNAELIHLNLMPGLISGVDVLRAVVSAIPIESAAVMETYKTGPYAMTEYPDIWADYSKVLVESGNPGELERIERQTFYDTVASDNVACTIATGEQRIYANLLLTIGVVMP